MLLVLSSALASARAQSSSPNVVRTAAQELTNGSSREWILTQVRMMMGPGGCAQGKVYRFSTDHTVTIESCVHGRMRHQVRRWTLLLSSSGNLVLDIADSSYRLLFYGPAYARMTLRQTATSKVVATTDLDFHAADE